MRHWRRKFIMADRSPVVRFLVGWVLYPIQAALISFLYYAISILPLRWATGIGSFLFQTIGPRIRVARVVEQNVRRVFPELVDSERKSLIENIWDNLGRGAGEFAHMQKFSHEGFDPRIEIVGLEHLDALRTGDRAGILISAHTGNWELAARIFGQILIPHGQVYRGANNPYVDRLLHKARQHQDVKLVPKGRTGAVEMLRLMRRGTHFGVMMDQKLNEGVAVPFFGYDAMTATAPVELALRNGSPIVPVRCIRLPNSYFRVEISPPIQSAITGDRETDVMAALVEINKTIENWIREYPEQWFWLHRRWPKE